MISIQFGTTQIFGIDIGFKLLIGFIPSVPICIRNINITITFLRELSSGTLQKKEATSLAGLTITHSRSVTIYNLFTYLPTIKLRVFAIVHTCIHGQVYV